MNSYMTQLQVQRYERGWDTKSDVELGAKSDRGASRADVDAFRSAMRALAAPEMGSMLAPKTGSPRDAPKSALTALDDALGGGDAALAKSLAAALDTDESSDDRPSKELAKISQLQRRNLNVSLAERAIGKSVSAIDQLVKMN
ncbi:hypothetical protein [Burkholderia ubonensis]|uniref:hypothetical protein n=1 Tax=Burkholderia ubonensis TaxID=101571 RepID=UPI0018DFC43C|nr:hypothetical protein [Burkholderia ubonensis]